VELDKNIEQELAELLANPEKVTSHHAAMLNELLQEYPYYQPLHLLLAKATRESADHDQLAKASLYTNGQVLHRFLFEKKISTKDFQVAGQEEEAPVQAEPETAADLHTAEEISAEEDITEDLYTFEEKHPEEEQENTAEELHAEEEIIVAEEVPVPEEETTDAEQHSPVTDEQETFEEIAEVTPVAAAVAAVPEEEVFDEIAEVDFNNYRPFRNSDNPEKEPQTGEHTERKHSLEDNFVFESIVSSDFFAFENKFSPEPAEAEKKTEQAPPFIEEHDEAAAAEVENSRVSNYHDDKLPYTFLWWLAKTRKEHQNIFQPYALPKKENSQELQQQYVEHIFHVQSHLTGNEALLDAAEPAKPAGRDFEIIESFIRNDPQITPPNAEQIDNENKAKKSAEDQNDLVSETLANIYIEQMLYDKAIDTYEKLSLKFPEKSRYFADLIQSIEKKI
jgi:hypothetical protein